MNTVLRRPERNATRLDYETYIRVLELVEKFDNLQVSAPLWLLNPSRGNMVIGVNPTVVDYSKYQFGFTVSGATVTIKSGEVRWGTHDPISIGDSTVTITQDSQFVGLSFDGTTITVLSPSTNEANFKSTDTTYKTWLYQFSFSGGMATLKKIGHIGNIEIPAFFGA